MAMVYVKSKRLKEVLSVKSERRDEVLNATVDYLIRLGLESHRGNKV